MKYFISCFNRKYKIENEKTKWNRHVDFEEETNSEYELDDEEDDISWLYKEYELSSDEKERGFLFKK